jgi:hypothetical protein
MNLNPLIINIVFMEREFEEQRQRQVAQSKGQGDLEPRCKSVGRKGKSEICTAHRQQMCEIA